MLYRSNPSRTRRGYRWLSLSAALALAVLCLAAVGADARSREAQPQNQSDSAPSPDAALLALHLVDINWGEAVDGLQPGFLLSRKGTRVSLNSQVDYTVLVRNTTAQELVFEVRFGEAAPWNDAPYVISGDSFQNATPGNTLRSRPLPERFRARDLADSSLVTASYYVKLAPGEAVVVPGKTGVYLGNADKARYPRLDIVRLGWNWIVQPVTVRLLSTAEQADFESILKTPYSSKKTVTIVGHDGKTRSASIPLIGAQGGGKQLYAQVQIVVGNGTRGR